MVDFATPGVATVEATLDRIVRCVREVAEPELIVLFGSRAWGSARDDSDYDLMIVLPDSPPSAPTGTAIGNRLREEGIAADVHARATSQYERYQRDPGFVDFVVARRGRVLYTAGRLPQLSAAGRRVREGRAGEGLAMWIRRGHSDLRMAEQSLAATDPVWDGVCFHAHASAEKLLKATVVREGTFPPRSHDLLDLLKLQPAALRNDPAVVAACALLMSVYPLSRYPESAEPTPEQAREAVVAARQVRDALAGYLGQDR